MFFNNKTKIPARKTNESQMSLFQHSDFQHGDYDLHVSNYGVGFFKTDFIFSVQFSASSSLGPDPPDR